MEDIITDADTAEEQTAANSIIAREVLEGTARALTSPTAVVMDMIIEDVVQVR